MEQTWVEDIRHRGAELESGQEGRLPCFVWKGFPTFRSHLRMRPVSRRHSRRGLVGGSTFRRTPISRCPLDKNPMPGHLFELHPVNEVNTKGQFFRGCASCRPGGPTWGSAPTGAPRCASATCTSTTC